MTDYLKYAIYDMRNRLGEGIDYASLNPHQLKHKVTPHSFSKESGQAV